ncbi:ABC transporter ATP-binding protein [Lacrimispora sp. NSJ-141]|uniref:ABC transporter ATP-binding protein n=1 Tax=Lientehia hominis TaxID=2897778 RepID=A0AAP2RLH4_9FIRM|nr:ABC transporter ATP-binding protein [Lientehia hominis]MCD2493223.1 ABC transporter ATP-binding protein [Lientehia hominis]
MNANLVVTGLTQKFGGLTALNDVNMEVRFGEIVGVIGPNGAGKTTLFNIITGVYQPTAGTIMLNEKKINGLKKYEITRLGFARTFQNIRLFKQMSVLDNVMMGMCCRSKASIFDNLFNTPKKRREEKLQEQKALEILETMGLLDYKYDSPASLPYGEQRRLEIARAMATDATILLLDEPAAGMNEQETADLLITVSKLRDSGYTIILIEHDMKFVMNVCDRLYVLNHGELICAGTPGEVKTNPDVINAYLGKEEEE